LQNKTETPKPNHTANQVPDGMMGEHITEKRPGSSPENIGRSREGKPMKNLSIKYFLGRIGDEIYNFYKVD
jgi:hypothetical protein